MEANGRGCSAETDANCLTADTAYGGTPPGSGATRSGAQAHSRAQAAGVRPVLVAQAEAWGEQQGQHSHLVHDMIDHSSTASPV